MNLIELDKNFNKIDVKQKEAILNIIDHKIDTEMNTFSQKLDNLENRFNNKFDRFNNKFDNLDKINRQLLMLIGFEGAVITFILTIIALK